MQRHETNIRDAGSIDLIRHDLIEYGVSIARVVSDERAEVIERSTSHIPSSLRDDGGTPHGAKGMGGITKTYGAACDPTVAQVRVMGEIRTLFASLFGLDSEGVMSGWDAVALTGMDATRTKLPTASALAHTDAQKAYVALTGSKLQPHIDVGVNSHGHAMEMRMKTLHPIMPCCIQGQYVVTSVPSGGATLVVSPGKYTEQPPDPEWFHVANGKDFCTCTPLGYEMLRDSWRSVEAPRGCVILWLSRTPHGNKLADFNVDPRRFVIYVSWQARALVSQDERNVLKRKKMSAVTSGATTDHWSTQVPRVYRGSHYSNGSKRTKVLYNAENRPLFDEELLSQIESSF